VRDEEKFFCSIAQLRERHAGLRWLVKGMLPKGSIGLLFGASGSYKTFLALDLGLSVALGIDWVGRPTKKGTVFYIAGEGGSSIVNRINAWLKSKGMTQVPSNFLICPSPVRLDCLGELELVREEIEQAAENLDAPALIIFDTLSQCSIGDEDNNTAISNLLTNITDVLLGAFPESVVLILHHPGHGDSRRMRGASALLANTDFVFRSEKNKDGKSSKLSVQKLKDGDLPPSLQISLDLVDLGRDSEGDPLSSLAVVGLDVSGPSQSESPRGKYECSISAELRGSEGFSEHELRRRIASKKEFDGSSAGAQAKGIARAIESLQEKNLIQKVDGVLLWRKEDD
jgi:hypothetical protein